MNLRLIVLLLSSAISAMASQMALFSTPKNTGSGPHDKYAIHANVGSDKATYALEISITKIDLNDVTVSSGETPLTIARKDIAKGYGKKFPFVFIELNRDQIDQGMKDGMPITVRSKTSTYSFNVTKEDFMEIEAKSEPLDSHRRVEKFRQQQEANEARLEAARQDAALKKKKFLESSLELLNQRPAPQPHPDVKGTAKVKGQAFLKTQGGDVKLGAGNMIWLYPDEEWSKLAMALFEEGVEASALSQAGQNFILKSWYQTEADANGNFEFENIPAGSFILRTSITWVVPGPSGTQKTGGAVQRQIDLQEGSTLKVNLTR